MTARYHVLISAALIMSHPQWPPMIRLVQPLRIEPAVDATWWLIEDDDADETWNGKRVQLTLKTANDVTQIERIPLP